MKMPPTTDLSIAIIFPTILPTPEQVSYMATKRIMDVMVVDLTNIYYDWCSQHACGINYCRQITKFGVQYAAACKKRDQFKSLIRQSVENCRILKILRDLQRYYMGLEQILGRLENSLVCIRQALYKMKMLVLTPGVGNFVFYRRLKMVDFVKFFEEVLYNYELEFQAKVATVEIKICIDVAKLKSLRLAWEHHCFVMSNDFRKTFTNNFFNEIKNMC